MVASAIQSRSKRAEEKREPVKEHLLVTRYDPTRVEKGEMLKLEDIREILRQEQEHQSDLAAALGEHVPDVSKLPARNASHKPRRG